MTDDEVSHVTMKLSPSLPTLRDPATYLVLLDAFRKGKDRFGFRLVHFSVQRDHIHMAVEVETRDAMKRGMCGLTTRIARALNKHWRRTGAVFRDRFHERVERRVTAVRKLLIYILHNFKKHEPNPAGRKREDVDTFCSGWWFDHWRRRFPEYLARFGCPRREPPIVPAQKQILRFEWFPHFVPHPTDMPSTLNLRKLAAGA